MSRPTAKPAATDHYTQLRGISPPAGRPRRPGWRDTGSRSSEPAIAELSLMERSRSHDPPSLSRGHKRPRETQVLSADRTMLNSVAWNAARSVGGSPRGARRWHGRGRARPCHDLPARPGRAGDPDAPVSLEPVRTSSLPFPTGRAAAPGPTVDAEVRRDLEVVNQCWGTAPAVVTCAGSVGRSRRADPRTSRSGCAGAVQYTLWMVTSCVHAGTQRR